MAIGYIRIIIFLFVIHAVLSGYSNQYAIDSLEIVLESNISAKKNTEVLNKLAYLYRVMDPEKSLDYSNKALVLAEANNLIIEKQKALSNLGLSYKYLGDYNNSIIYQAQALELAKTFDNKSFIAVEYNRLGILYKRLGLYTDALDHYHLALKIYQELDKKRGIANLYNNIGNIYRKWGDMDVALDYYFKSLKLVQQLDDKEIYAYILNNIGNLYASMEIYDQALEYHKQSLQVKKEMNNYYGISTSFKNIGDINLDLKNPQKALEYLDECLALATKYGYKDIIIELNTSYGLAHLQLNNYEKARKYISKAIEEQAELGDIAGLIDAYISVSKIYIQQKLYSEAETQLLKSLPLAIKENFLHDIAEINLQLSILSEKTGRFSESLRYFKKYSSIRDSIFNTEIDNKITELKIKQKSDEFEAERTILEEKNKFQQLSIQRKNYFIYAMIGVTLLILILVVLIFFEYNNKHKTNKKLAQTNQKLSEKNNFLQVLMDTIPNPMYYTNSKGKYIDCNSAFLDLHQMTNSEIFGKTVFDLYPEESARKLHEDDMELIRNKGMQQVETTIKSDDNKTKDVIYYKNTFDNSRGLVAGMVGLMLDISDRKKSEDKIKESEQKLRQANATKDKFFSIIAHDLKNPFNAILGFVNILNAEYEHITDEEKIKIIANLSMASESTYKLLQNLLEWSKTQTGQLEIVPEVFDLRTLTQENITVLNSHAHSKKISITSNVENNTLVKADKNMIDTVLRNLISNAIKFTNIGGKVKIFCYRQNGSVKACIEDNGIGIDHQNIKKLFFIDQQFKTKGTANELGSGLGLILCKEFIKKNNGS
ncbi:MAG: tetratricopeptide repeat protein [Bacteroidales bacterium]|nr:tetratricopeptide repeat protein [Bacteroidales bacterium]